MFAVTAAESKMFGSSMAGGGHRFACACIAQDKPQMRCCRTGFFSRQTAAMIASLHSVELTMHRNVRDAAAGGGVSAGFTRRREGAKGFGVFNKLSR
jgi:hypothetical protein